MDEFEKLVEEEKLTKVAQDHHRRRGAASSRFGTDLQAVESKGSEFVAIHDGARPLTTPKLIRHASRWREHGAACCASPIPDTVKRASIEQMVAGKRGAHRACGRCKRRRSFSSGLILQAYASLMAKHEMVTDEVSAVQKLGKKIALLKNEDWNFKITFPHDLELAEHVLQLRAKKKTIS